MTQNYFNDISLFTFDELGKFDCNNITSSLSSIENQFTQDINELKKKSVGNKTTTTLLNAKGGAELIIKGIVRERSLVTQTEYINANTLKLAFVLKKNTEVLV
jgi:hypothetical protein